MEWGINNYDSTSKVFSDSRIRAQQSPISVTGGSGNTKYSGLTYATPYWWLLERIKADGFPNARLNVVG